ncbi:ethanolamine kinase B [Cavenderia fasciculata]|uniref:ethanolamine kinase n=1 Tax=Cavenderia fasciculata TaxID=261658 RepID=F4Q5H9_CACFS|nr:ethanolamine kinase B [Cavenderia fasciculata]EGG17238.1 ethanolamine kinase B [Cavenderia fasciculata]|eukprot:XP_004355722.1 ethanolamine kinase B [Cavenderia fasciculata]
MEIKWSAADTTTILQTMSYNQFEEVLLPQHLHVMEHIDYENTTNNSIHQRLMNVMRELVDDEFDDEITFKTLVGGVTNTLFKATFKNSEGNYKSIIIRLYGKASENFIDRKQESHIQRLLSDNGVGPKFYGTFSNGCIYGFVEGDQLQLEDLESDNILNLIAMETSKWHSMALEGLKTEPTTFSYLTSWIDSTKQLLLKNSSFDCGIDIDYYVKEANYLMEFLKSRYNQPHHIVFCHNDLIPRNMIYNKEKNIVKYIDFEYSGYNFRGFDLGNFFCEFSGLDLDYTRYPSVQKQKQFIRYYLKALHSLDDLSKVDETEVHQLYVEANHFTLASHLMWGFWGIISHFGSTIDFDYIDYANKRFKQYDLVKKKVYSII